MLIQLNILQYMSAVDNLYNFIELCFFLIPAFYVVQECTTIMKKECSYVHESKIYTQKEVFRT